MASPFVPTEFEHERSVRLTKLKRRTPPATWKHVFSLGLAVSAALALNVYRVAAKEDRTSGKESNTRIQTGDELKEYLKPIPAKTPEEAQKQFETVGGFRMELVAREPQVVSPIAAEFDENGQLYVCEMTD